MNHNIGIIPQVFCREKLSCDGSTAPSSRVQSRSATEYNCEYFKVINPEVEAGIVKNFSREEAKINKLRLSIAFLNLYRLVETLSELGKINSIEILEQAISFFRLGLAFLLEKNAQVVNEYVLSGEQIKKKLTRTSSLN